MLADDLSPTSAALGQYEPHRQWGRRERGSIMKEAAAGSADKANQPRMPRKSSDEQIALHLCYGQIGISAVAAAARYQSSTKTAHTLSAVIPDEQSAGAA